MLIRDTNSNHSTRFPERIRTQIISALKSVPFIQSLMSLILEDTMQHLLTSVRLSSGVGPTVDAGVRSATEKSWKQDIFGLSTPRARHRALRRYEICPFPLSEPLNSNDPGIPMGSYGDGHQHNHQSRSHQDYIPQRRTGRHIVPHECRPLIPR
jgi:hypothetical protein